MNVRNRAGELALAGFFAAVGIFWIVTAAKLSMWDGFSPASGFLPLLYGVLLVGLAIAATVVDVFGSGDNTEGQTPIDRPMLILLALAAGVAGIDHAGFFASMFLAMLFLFRIAERLPLASSFATAAGTALVLTLVFRTWLGVPLPAGPWGF